jgi:hypothetical protein
MHCSLDVLPFQMLATHDFFERLPRGQVIEDHGNHHSSSLDANPTMTDVWINADAISPVHLIKPLIIKK